MECPDIDAVMLLLRQVGAVLSILFVLIHPSQL
jgi:hypothetical protein